MSDVSQGEGWWQASDGKWYPPQVAPGVQPPPAGPRPAGVPPAGVAPKSNTAAKGCLIVAGIVFGIFLLIGVAALVLIATFGDDVAENALGGGPCPFLSDDEASDALGDGTEAIETKGLSNVLVIIDARVLPSAHSCALLQDAAESQASDGGLGRVARYEGSDADERYELELEKAKGVTEDRGGGITVTSDEYLNKELEEFGDEAFCTKSSGVGAGVLVREGDTLVYASVVADVEGAPGIDLDDPDNPKLGTDDRHCEIAQAIARNVLD